MRTPYSVCTANNHKRALWGTKVKTTRPRALVRPRPRFQAVGKLNRVTFFRELRRPRYSLGSITVRRICATLRLLLRAFLFPREPSPVWSAWGEGRHDRRGVSVCGQQLNAPTTPTAGGMLWPVSARCNGASGSVLANSGLLAPADDRNALATTPAGKKRK